MYIADFGNHRIRKVERGRSPRSPAASTWEFSGDGGPATSAGLAQPVAVAIDGAGNLYIADRSTCGVRKVDAAGVITTVAGDGTNAVATAVPQAS